MTKPQLRAVELSSLLSSVEGVDLDAISRWLHSDETHRELSDATAHARRAIAQLNESREVTREELYRPITLM